MKALQKNNHKGRAPSTMVFTAFDISNVKSGKSGNKKKIINLQKKKKYGFHRPQQSCDCGIKNK
jgi:hypothetical protein